MPKPSNFQLARAEVNECQRQMLHLTKAVQTLQNRLNRAVARLNRKSLPTTGQERKGPAPKGASYFSLGVFWKIDRSNRLMQHTGTAWVRSTRDRKNIINKPILIFATGE
jgi:hypothetical protein